MFSSSINFNGCTLCLVSRGSHPVPSCATGSKSWSSKIWPWLPVKRFWSFDRDRYLCLILDNSVHIRTAPVTSHFDRVRGQFRRVLGDWVIQEGTGGYWVTTPWNKTQGTAIKINTRRKHYHEALVKAIIIEPESFIIKFDKEVYNMSLLSKLAHMYVATYMYKVHWTSKINIG